MAFVDAGSGLGAFGRGCRESMPQDIDLLFSHLHLDHTAGLPFFKPFFDPRNRWRLWAGHLGGAMTLHRVLCEFMMAPLFPVPPEVFKAYIRSQVAIFAEAIKASGAKVE